MNVRWSMLAPVIVLGGALISSEVLAQSMVSYGRITAVRQVDLESSRARGTGALVGGAAGLASGSGRSTSNQALRTLGGVAVGSRVGGAMGSSTGFEYTVLINNTSTVNIVTEKAGLRVRDCVSVERGQFNNIRLAPDDRCDVPQATVPAAAASAADACAAATQGLLDAETDEEFDRAERRMRLLCD